MKLKNIERDYFDTLICNLYEFKQSLWKKNNSGYYMENKDSDDFGELLIETLYSLNIYGNKEGLGLHTLYQYFREIFKDLSLEEALEESQIIYENWGDLQAC